MVVHLANLVQLPVSLGVIARLISFSCHINCWINLVQLPVSLLIAGVSITRLITRFIS
jgi:hypothetical protein